LYFFFFSSRRRHTRSTRDWSSDVCSSDYHVDGPCTQARRQPGGEGASQQGVPPPAPLLAAAHLTSQPLERGGEGQAAPMVATVERRDQYDAQAREGARRHTST